MRFYLFFVLSVLVAGTFLCLAAVSAKRRRSVRGTSLPAPVHLLFVGLVAASFLLFIPLYLSANELKGGRVLEAIPLALHNTIRLFVVDGEITVSYEEVGYEETAFCYMLVDIYGNAYWTEYVYS